MTNCIVLGERAREQKKIKLVKVLQSSLGFTVATKNARDWQNLELISKACPIIGTKYDMIFAYDSERDLGCLYLGEWNDGIV